MRKFTIIEEGHYFKLQQDGRTVAVISDCSEEEAQKIARLMAEKAHWQEGRKEGRREALVILTSQRAEEFADEYLVDLPIGCTGEYGTYWKHAELTKLLDCEKHESVAERSEEAYWECAFKESVLEEKLEKLTKQRDELLAALKRVMQLARLEGETIFDMTERADAMFLKETGMKSYRHDHGSADHPERMIAYGKWVDSISSEAMAAIAKAEGGQR